MTECQYLHPSPCDGARVLCEEQLLFVVGRELFGKFTVHIACVCVRSSVSLHTSLCLLRMNLCWLAITWLGKTKERDPNRHSALRTVSVARVCCLYVSNPRLNQGWLPSGLGLQLNRLYRRSGVWTLPGQSSFVCSVYQPVTGCVYVYGTSRPSWPQCPDSPPAPSPLPRLAERDGREWFSYLPSGLTTRLAQ